MGKLKDLFKKKKNKAQEEPAEKPKEEEKGSNGNGSEDQHSYPLANLTYDDIPNISTPGDYKWPWSNGNHRHVETHEHYEDYYRRNIFPAIEDTFNPENTRGIYNLSDFVNGQYKH